MIIDENAHYKIRTGDGPCGIKKYPQLTIVRSGAWVLKNKARKPKRVFIGSGGGNMGTIIEKVEKNNIPFAQQPLDKRYINKYAKILAKNIDGEYDIDLDGDINNSGTMFTAEEALDIEAADLSDWDSVWIEVWEGDDEILDTIDIK